jgi:hypothetical protein
MVQVRLARTWTDAGGAAHGAGDLVDVDAITLARLEACGVVTPNESSDPQSDEPTREWAGPTGPTDDDETAQWAGPTGDDDSQADWAGPTGDPK